MSRILIADDHPIYLEGVARLIRGLRHEVVTSKDGEEALSQIQSTTPDLSLLDIKMPKFSGLTVLRKLNEEHSTTKVILISGYVDPDSVYEAIRVGAKGYLLKSCPVDMVISSVARVLNGEIVLPSEIHSDLAEAIVNRANPLTKRETEILTLSSEGLSTACIAERLFISPPTVKVHLSHAYKKLGVENKAAAIHEAMKRGILE